MRMAKVSALRERWLRRKQSKPQSASAEELRPLLSFGHLPLKGMLRDPLWKFSASMSLSQLIIGTIKSLPCRGGWRGLVFRIDAEYFG
jgi:hypothetical protein